MSSKDIYGAVPEKDSGDSEVVSSALSSLSKSESNKVQGPVKGGKNVEYDPENGK
jgi:hypothetical protein